MILKDFLTGGFPITRRTPVICSFADGTVEVVYNRFDLKEVTEKIVKDCVPICLGVWPGKKNTDCFIIDPKIYSEIVPPKMHADIDSAEGIKIVRDDCGAFEGVQYTPGPFAKDRTPIISKEKELLEYIQHAGLRSIKVIGSINDL